MPEKPFHRALGMSLVSFSLILGLAGVASDAQAASWTLQKQDAGIDVYTRPVAGSDIAEFKGEGMVDVDTSKIVALLRDANQFKKWFPNTSESKLLKRDGDISYQYSVMDTPWPISDRDNVFKSITKTDPTTGRVDITVSADPSAYPIQDGRHRVTKANGSWQLTPKGPGKTLVVFTMHLEPGGGLPDWLVNSRVVETPYEALVNLRKILGANATQ